MAFLPVGGDGQHGNGECLHGPATRRCRATQALELLPRLPRCRHLERVEEKAGLGGGTRLELGPEGVAQLAPQPLARLRELGGHGGGAVHQLLGRASHRGRGLEHLGALADDPGHPLVDGERSGRPVGRDASGAVPGSSTAAPRSDSRSSK